MNEKYKRLIVELSEELIKEIFLFLSEVLVSGEENTSDIINLVLSANLTCAFQSMKMIALGNKEIEEKVNEFITHMKDSIVTLSMIEDCEINYKH